MNKALYVDLDAHKNMVAVAEEGCRGEAGSHGTIINSANAALWLTKTLQQKTVAFHGAMKLVPCGYGIDRGLLRLEFECAVVSSALT